VIGTPVLHQVTAGCIATSPINPTSIEAQIQGGALMAYRWFAGGGYHAQG
jgi:CO/xanthine dehydrogenase Mo-binding subunit